MTAEAVGRDTLEAVELGNWACWTEPQAVARRALRASGRSHVAPLVIMQMSTPRRAIRYGRRFLDRLTVARGEGVAVRVDASALVGAEARCEREPAVNALPVVAAGHESIAAAA